MGACQSSSDTAASPLTNNTRTKLASETQTDSTNVTNFVLKKRRAGCSGMFWRTDPAGKIQLTGNANWPRDDAIINGKVIVDDDGDKWLKAAKIKQKGAGQWLEVPDGAFLPDRKSVV